MAQYGNLSSEMETLSHIFSLVEAFKAFDSDNDGLITSAELGGLMGSLGYNASEQDVVAMMEQGDRNKDGMLSLNEFLEMNTKDMEIGVLGNVLRNAFECFNGNGDDVVTGDELHDVVKNIGIEISLDDCHDIIDSIDGDGDGAISLEDFQLIVNSL